MPVIALCDDRLTEVEVDATALGGVDPGAPVVVMIHGFRYSPSRPVCDPHRHILSLSPDLGAWGSVSWPRRLGLGGTAGVGLAWGWEAGGSIWAAYCSAERSGAALARVITRLRCLVPDRPVHVIAHSLGARVACEAVSRLGAGDVDRVVLMAAALSRAEALRAVASPAGKRATFVNVSGAENRIFDLVLRLALPLGGRRLVPGVVQADGWVELRLDSAEVLGQLAQQGWRIACPRASVCHWSGYLRPGVWRLYRDLLTRTDTCALGKLRLAVAQAERSALLKGEPKGIFFNLQRTT